MIPALMLDARLYARLVAMQLRSQMQYKLDMALDILTYFLVTGMEFGAILLYFVPFPTMLGWRIGEVAMLGAIASIGFGLAELFGGGIADFDEVIRLGDFDRVLLRPVTALTQISTTKFRLRRLGRISEGVGAFILSLVLLHGSALNWDLLKVLVLLLGILSSGMIFISIMLLGATLCFWTVEVTELTSSLTYGGREMLSYPLTVYHQLLQRLFVFIVPLAFGAYIPVCYVLGRALPFGLPAWLAFISPLIALLFTLLAISFWGYGVHHYQSTGS